MLIEIPYQFLSIHLAKKIHRAPINISPSETLLFWRQMPEYNQLFVAYHMLCVQRRSRIWETRKTPITLNFSEILANVLAKVLLNSSRFLLLCFVTLRCLKKGGHSPIIYTISGNRIILGPKSFFSYQILM